jgi:hypothetical protein
MIINEPVRLKDLPPQQGLSFPITIDPKTPAKELLPKPPKTKSQTPSAFLDDLAKVPELTLSEHIANNDPKKAMETIAHQVARINHLNAGKKDRFMEVLLAERTDLAGLPFQMGEACRMPIARSRHFARSVGMVHNSLNGQQSEVSFLQNLMQVYLSDDEGHGKVPRGAEDHVSPARVAAMMQICGPAPENMRLAMAKYIASVSRSEATQALARLVLFAPEDDVRAAALAALKARKEKDYTDALLQGFRYPWPGVAKRAADALVKLDRKDLTPQLIDVLEEPDPRAPVMKKAENQSVAMVREVVRINHHRNCLMCHAPGQDVVNNGEIMVAETPVPGQPLPSFNSGGYQSQGVADLLVRIDVTYLRQDFSMMLPVEHAAPWPEMQRFDFVTRTRVLGEDELKQYREKFENLEPGVLPPNQKAALVALRELTGKDTAPTAEAWRKLLKINK